jgi:hypothetical protein
MLRRSLFRMVNMGWKVDRLDLERVEFLEIEAYKEKA